MRRRQATLAIATSALLTLLSPFTSGENFQDRLTATYQGQVLNLRHFCRGAHLSFNSRGDSTCGADPGFWTSDGQVLISRLELKGQTLRIHGQRRYLFYDGAKKEFRDVLTVRKGEPAANLFTKLPNPDWRRQIEAQQQVEIEIGLDTDKPSFDDLSGAMMAVFLKPGEAVSSLVPPFWHAYFVHQETGIESPPDSPEPVYQVKAGEVSPARSLSSPDPEYSETARTLGYGGTVVLSLVVDSTGAPKDIQIVKPAGLGLDEKAFNAVSAWRFEPAQKDARPVAVRIHVEVSFRLN